MILGDDTITVVRGPLRDNWGDRTGTQASHDIAGCSVQPGSAVEQTSQGEMLVTNLTVFLPGGSDILATDWVRWAGQLWQVNGDPARWRDETGAEDHVQAQLLLYKGSD